MQVIPPLPLLPAFVPDPTPEQVRAFYAYMPQHFGTEVVDKRTDAGQRAIAAALDMAGVIDAADFLSRFATTIGSTIAVPFEPGVVVGRWLPWSQIRTLIHECQHVHQWNVEGLGYAARYVAQQSARANYELAGYRAGMTADVWHLGAAVVLRQDPAADLASYAVRLEDVEVTRELLDLSLATIMAGGILDESARVGLAWLEQEAPELAWRSAA